MDEKTLLNYINTVSSYGDEGLTKRFTQVIKSLYNDERIAKMPEANQKELFSKVFNKYSQEVEGSSGASVGALVGSQGGNTPEGAMGEYTGTSETAERATGALGEAFKERIGSTLAGAGAASVIGGVPIEDALRGSLTGGSLTSLGIGAIGDAITSGLGFGVGRGFTEKLTSSGLSMALGMVNPALGLAANVLGKPIADLLGDATGLRDLDAMRDAVEDKLGQLGGRRAYADAYNDISEAWGGVDNMGDYKDYQSFTAVSDALGARAESLADKYGVDHPEVMEAMARQKAVSSLVDIEAGEAKDIWGDMSSAAKQKVAREQEISQAGVLGVTTQDLAERKRVASKYGLSSITGTQVTQKMQQEKDEKKASGSSSSGGVSIGYDKAGNITWGGSSGYSSRDSGGGGWGGSDQSSSNEGQASQE